MSQKQKEILFGTLLGDASLQTYTNGRTWRARFIQGDVHKEYLFHLYGIFEDLVGTAPKDITDKQGSQRWYFNTRVVDGLYEFGEMFYLKKRKIVPGYNHLEEYLTPRALAYWYQDDGSLKSNAKAHYLCTDNFTLNELKCLSEFFSRK
jgi:hypothetical protein